MYVSVCTSIFVCWCRFKYDIRYLWKIFAPLQHTRISRSTPSWIFLELLLFVNWYPSSCPLPTMSVTGIVSIFVLSMVPRVTCLVSRSSGRTDGPSPTDVLTTPSGSRRLTPFRYLQIRTKLSTRWMCSSWYYLVLPSPQRCKCTTPNMTLLYLLSHRIATVARRNLLFLHAL